MTTTKYYVSRERFNEEEVTLEVYIEAERLAGFSGPGHFSSPKTQATEAFSNNGISGRIDYQTDMEL